jgi:hypothetical protein
MAEESIPGGVKAGVSGDIDLRALGDQLGGQGFQAFLSVTVVGPGEES